MEINRLGFIHENFYSGDSLAKQGNIVHEISSIYDMKVPESCEPVYDRFTEDGNKGWLIVFRKMYLR